MIDYLEQLTWTDYLYIWTVGGFIAGFIMDCAVKLYRGKTFIFNPIWAGVIGIVLGPFVMLWIGLYDIIVQGWYDNNF